MFRSFSPPQSINSFVVCCSLFFRGCTFSSGFLSLCSPFHIFAFCLTPKPIIYFPSNVPCNGRLRLKQLDRQISGFRLGIAVRKSFYENVISQKTRSVTKYRLQKEDRCSLCRLRYSRFRFIRIWVSAMLKKLEYFHKTLIKHRSHTIST